MYYGVSAPPISSNSFPLRLHLLPLWQKSNYAHCSPALWSCLVLLPSCKKPSHCPAHVPTGWCLGLLRDFSPSKTNDPSGPQRIASASPICNRFAVHMIAIPIASLFSWDEPLVALWMSSNMHLGAHLTVPPTGISPTLWQKPNLLPKPAKGYAPFFPKTALPIAS